MFQLGTVSLFCGQIYRNTCNNYQNLSSNDINMCIILLHEVLNEVLEEIFSSHMPDQMCVKGGST